MNFWKRFEEAEDEFTYFLPEDPDGSPAIVQVGLVATLFLKESWRIRDALLLTTDRYCEQFGKELTWLISGETRAKKLTKANYEKMKAYVFKEGEYNAVEWTVANKDYDHAWDYSISCFSIANWSEEVHGGLSYLKMYWPVELLKTHSQNLLAFLKETCSLLKPVHGSFGLGVQQSYEEYEHQHTEYEIAKALIGLDVGPPVLAGRLVQSGFKTINWITIISDELLARKGGEEMLQLGCRGTQVTYEAYAGGFMIKAGQMPALGWVNRPSDLAAYCEANRILKPLRASSISLALGSIGSEVRFNARTAGEWLTRFDDESLWPSPEARVPKSDPNNPPSAAYSPPSSSVLPGRKLP